VFRIRESMIAQRRRQLLSKSVWLSKSAWLFKAVWMGGRMSIEEALDDALAIGFSPGVG
jgi:hypothetical protein